MQFRYFLNVIIFLGLSLTVYGYAEPNRMIEYCEDSSFNPSCGPDEVIMMQSARYGRMEVATCLAKDYGHLGCSADILGVLDGMCSGRRSCDVDVRDLMVSGQKPCPKDLRSYLEAQYACLPIITSDDCCAASSYTAVTEAAGFLGNIFSEETSCGTIDCPWKIKAGNGQRINLTLYDFVPPPAGHSRSSGITSSICHVYAIIKEWSSGSTPKTVCGGEGRIRNLYESASSTVEIRVVNKNREEREAYFMMEYNLIGCADPPLPRYGWLRRTGPDAVVGCDSDPSFDRWKLTCKNHVWVGEAGNCTQVDPFASSGLLDNILTMSPNISVVTIALIALIISIIILAIGIIYLRKRWLKNTDRAHQYHGNGRHDDSLAYDHPRNTRLLVTADHANKTTVTSCISERGAPQNYYPTPRNMGGGCMKPPVPPPSIPPPARPYHGVDMSAMEATAYDPDGQFADHVYESPNFERRSQPGESGVYTGESGACTADDTDSCCGAQYFELEPDGEPLTSVCRQPGDPHMQSVQPPHGAQVLAPENVVDCNGVVWRKSNINNNHNSQSNVGIPPLTPRGIAVAQRCSFPGTNGPCRAGREQTHNTRNGQHAGGAMTS